MILFLIILGVALLFSWGPDIMNYFIDRYDEWRHVFHRIKRRTKR